LIDDHTVATNYHCLLNSLQFLKSENAEKKVCDDVIIEFDYLRAGTLGVSTKCTAVRPKKELDVALLTVDAAAIRRSTGEVRNPVRPIPVGSAPAGKVNIIHHPQGLPLSYELNCRLKAIEGIELLHDCDTASGSSGSPLFDEQMRWVGLHYKGPYPSTWTVQMIEQHIKDYGKSYNRAKMSGEIMSFAQSISPN
jgi:V8-like Glu-specific endopeptidase